MNRSTANPEFLVRFARAYTQRRYAVLFYSLLVTIAAGPLIATLGLDSGVLEVLLAANLVAAVVPVTHGPGRGLLLAVPVAACAVRFGGVWLNYPQVAIAGLAMWTFVAMAAAVEAVRYAIRSREVDREHLYAGLDAYLLIGVFFGVLYWCLERLSPGSIAVVDQGEATALSLPDSIYFSFVTLVTLGYGDILPRSDAARGLAIVEAVTGQLYLTVMVAYLVSLFVRGAAEKGPP